MKKTMKTIYKTTGHRTINGTKWPIEAKLYAEGGVYKVLTGLCNGAPNGAPSIYRLKRDAFAVWDTIEAINND